MSAPISPSSSTICATKLDKFADDASFNGINPLRGDKLRADLQREPARRPSTSRRRTPRATPTFVSNSTLGDRHGRRIAILDSDDDIDARLDQLKDALGRAALAGLVLRLEPLDGSEPHRLHQEDDQHAGDRRRQPDPRRYQRGSGEPPGPADPPAAVRRRRCRWPRRPTRRCCACSSGSVLVRDGMHYARHGITGEYMQCR